MGKNPYNQMMEQRSQELRLSFLGTFQAQLGGQIITHFRSTNVQGLLVYLALQAERPFPRDVLATLFWPNSPENVAKTNLRQTLYQLRKVLNDLGDKERPFLNINRQTVQFNPDSDYLLDATQFLTAIERGDFETAVTLYQAELLPGFTCDSLEFENWLRQERERFHLLGLDAIDQQFSHSIRQQKFSKAKQLAQQQINLEPWNENGHQNLITAMALNGEKSAALNQYKKTEDILWEELGTPPSSKINDLIAQIERDEIKPAAQTISSISTDNHPKHNLQSLLTPFFAREEDLLLLQKRIGLPKYRLITLVGEGGIGKSRLANELGWHCLDKFKEGVWFVPLAGLSSAQEGHVQENNIALAILQACNQPLAGQQEPKQQLLTYLKEKQLLLILDNFEHLLNGGQLLIELLQQSPKLVVLCTSREPLDFMAEWAYSVKSLPIPKKLNTANRPSQQEQEAQLASVIENPTMRLFEDRANRALGEFELTTANQSLVIELCHLVQGIPLGLELAAAGLRQRPLPDLIHSLQQSLDSLMTHKRDIPERHRNIRTVFENSWTLLSKYERAAFGTLALFQGGFTLKAAQAVTGTTADVLYALKDKSLVRHEANGRFSIHELLRQFAIEKLASPEANTIWLFTDPQNFILEEHSHYYLNAVANLQNALNGETPNIPCDWIADDLDNIRLAWNTAVANQQYQTIQNALRPLSDFYQIRGLYREGERQFGKAILKLNKNPDGNQTNQLKTIAHLQTQQAALQIRLSQYHPAIELLSKALHLSQNQDDNWLVCRIQISWGEALWRQGQLEDAEQQLNQARALAIDINDTMLVGISTYHLGVIHDLKGHHKQSLTLFEEALKIFEALGNGRWQGFALSSVGGLAHRLSNLEKAEKALLEALKINKKNNDWQGQLSTLNNLGLLFTQLSQFDKSKTFLFQALEISRITGGAEYSARINYNLAWNEFKRGDVILGEQFTQLALEIYRQIGSQRGEGQALYLLGQFNVQKGFINEATQQLTKALDLSQQIGDSYTKREVQKVLSNISSIGSFDKDHSD